MNEKAIEYRVTFIPSSTLKLNPSYTNSRRRKHKDDYSDLLQFSQVLSLV